MSLIFCPLYSGSSGNCLLIKSENTVLLSDAGLSGTSICKALDTLSILPETINGIVITHEHIDHVKGAGILARKHKIPIYANEKTWQAMQRYVGTVPEYLKRTFQSDSDFYIGDINVEPFPIPHDAAEPVGFRFNHSGISVATATDIGFMFKGLSDILDGCHIVLIESNYDPQLLKDNPHYSYQLKQRIAGRHGHLSNTECAKTILSLYKNGVNRFVLGHLSAENNTPEIALLTIKEYLSGEGIIVGKDLSIDLAFRDRINKVFRIESGDN